MSVLPDQWIRAMSKTHRMIEPFEENSVRPGRISFGVSSYGYDLRLSQEFKIPEFESDKPLDPKKIDLRQFRDVKSRSCLIPANSFILGRSLEYFRIPRDILTFCQGKSTYARCGVVINVTPFEPQWEGFATISLANTARVPVKVYAGEGIAQLVFIRAESECETSYSERKGKYQAQKQIQLARI